MSFERAKNIAYRLLSLGVSKAMVEDLLSHYDYDLMEHQLDMLPYRKAKRPEALIVMAIKKNYSTPNLNHHAKNQALVTTNPILLDEGSELPSGPAPSEPQGH